MALFKKKNPVQTTTVLFNKTFTQSGTFRGYRRVKLTTYNEDLVQDTLNFFAKRNYDFKGCTITIESLLLTDVFVDKSLRLVNVFVDGKQIGCVYDNEGSERYPLLAECEYDKVHLRVEGNEVYLFIHLKN